MPTFDISFTFSVVFLFYLNKCNRTFSNNLPHVKKIITQSHECRRRKKNIYQRMLTQSSSPFRPPSLLPYPTALWHSADRQCQSSADLPIQYANRKEKPLRMGSTPLTLKILILLILCPDTGHSIEAKGSEGSNGAQRWQRGRQKGIHPFERRPSAIAIPAEKEKQMVALNSRGNSGHDRPES